MPSAGAARRRLRQSGQVPAVAVALPVRFRRPVLGERIPGGARAAVMLPGARHRMAGMMSLALARTVAAGIVVGASLVATAGSIAVGSETSPQPTAQVAVVRAANACFTSVVRVTGFLVAREN